jgi:hypothetical protein
MKFICLLLVSVSLYGKVFEFKGKALKENGKLAYNEEHKITYTDEGKILLTETTYFYDGKKIAYLYNNYSENAFAPTHKFEDYRFDYNYGMDVKGNKAKMFYNEGDEKKKDKIELRKNSISSQGFNTYLSSKLSKVEQDEVFDFIIPGKMTRVDFKVNYEDSEDEIKFILKADSFFIRLLAPKMVIKYSKDGRIRYYNGPSNLPDNKEKNQKVEITYQYPDEA